MGNPVAGHPHEASTGGEQRHPVPDGAGDLAVDQDVLHLALARGAKWPVAVARPAGPHGQRSGGGTAVKQRLPRPGAWRRRGGHDLGADLDAPLREASGPRRKTYKIVAVNTAERLVVPTRSRNKSSFMSTSRLSNSFRNSARHDASAVFRRTRRSAAAFRKNADLAAQRSIPTVNETPL